MNKILVVDDEKGIRMLFADELSAEGFEVISTGNGSRVMDLIDQERPDLIVLDIRLGKYSGLDILQDIKSRYLELPVILCTAYSAFKRNKKSKTADHFIVKSSNLNELKSKIRTALALGENQGMSSVGF